MDLQKRVRGFVLKLREADRKAGLAAEPQVQIIWQEIAQSWGFLARQLRQMEDRSFSVAKGDGISSAN